MTKHPTAENGSQNSTHVQVSGGGGCGTISTGGDGQAHNPPHGPGPDNPVEQQPTFGPHLCNTTLAPLTVQLPAYLEAQLEKVNFYTICRCSVS